MDTLSIVKWDAGDISIYVLDNKQSIQEIRIKNGDLTAKGILKETIEQGTSFTQYTYEDRRDPDTNGEYQIQARDDVD